MKRITTLDAFKLFYEDIERKEVVNVKSLLNKNKPLIIKLNKIRSALNKYIMSLSERLSNIKLEPKVSDNKPRKLTKAERRERLEQRKRGILGIGLLLTVVSIGYSTVITREFVSNRESLVVLAPQVIFAGVTLIKAFSKLYK